MLPACTAAGSQRMGLPFLTGLLPTVPASCQVPKVTSHRRCVFPRNVLSAFSRITSARMAHASSRDGALMWTRSKKSASAGYSWILLCAAEPERASAVATPGRSSKPTTAATLRKWARSSGLKSSIVTRWP